MEAKQAAQASNPVTQEAKADSQGHLGKADSQGHLGAYMTLSSKASKQEIKKKIPPVGVGWGVVEYGQGLR